MIKTVLCFLILAFAAQAGVLRVASYPFRVSPVKLFAPVVHVVTFPFFHPVQTLRPLVFPIVHPKRFWVFAPHGPTLPPDPWADGVILKLEGAF